MPAVITSFFDDVMSRTVYHIRGTDLIPLEECEDWLRAMCLSDKSQYGISFPAYPPQNYLYLPMLGDRTQQWHKAGGNGLTLRQFREAGEDPEPLRRWLLESCVGVPVPGSVLLRAQDPEFWRVLYGAAGKWLDGDQELDGRRADCTPFDADQFYSATGYRQPFVPLLG